TEAQFIQFVHRDLSRQARPDPGLIRLALQTRRTAEKIANAGGCDDSEHAAIELVYPWIAKAVAAADVERLRGEDKRVSSARIDWDDARVRLTAAAQHYEKIGQTASSVRSAIRARDRVMAELPYYARWIAGAQDDSHATVDRLLERIESTAAATHVLSARLEQVDPDRVNELNTSIMGEFLAIKSAFNEHITQLAPTPTPFMWHQIDNALQVPFIPAHDRERLIADLRRISAKLMTFAPGQRPASEPAAAIVSAQATAQRHGRLALALLGDRGAQAAPATSQAGAAKYPFGELQQLLRQRAPGYWWKPVKDQA